MPKSLANGSVKLGLMTVAPVDIHAVKLTEVTAGKELTETVVKSSYQLGAAAADKVNEPALGDTMNRSVPGNSNYTAQMDFFRFLDGTGKSVVNEDIPFQTFTGKGVRCWLVERIGAQASAALPWAAGDLVNVYEVITDDPQAPKDYNSWLKFNQMFHTQDVATRVALA